MARIRTVTLEEADAKLRRGEWQILQDALRDPERYSGARALQEAIRVIKNGL
jgi:Tfp pilus assembly protein PilX